jgi:hypothetical protein
MTGLDQLADPLADLQPTPPRTAEKRARLISLADSILAARKRRVSLAKIAERLDVSPDYLSQVMTEHHGEAWVSDTARRSHKGKGRKKAKTRTRVASVATTELTTDLNTEAEDNGAALAEDDAQVESTDGAEVQSATQSPPSDDPNSKYAGPRRQTIRV